MSNFGSRITLGSTNVALNGRPILQDVEFEAGAGDVHCIIGPNGSGKSTLLRVLTGDIDVDGLSYDDINVRNLTPSRRAEYRSVLRPSVRPDFPYSVADVVSWSQLRDAGSNQAGDARSNQAGDARSNQAGITGSNQAGITGSNTVRDTLTRVGILDLVDRPITQLSTGQLTKVNIASVLVQEATIVFADEPEAALDPVARVEAWRLLTAEDFTSVIATHSLDLVLEFATHVTAIQNGRVIYTRPASELTMGDLKAVYQSA
jgi:ABC-type cobalamin/Fe3+-siderophores transport system ATPase subunit